MEQSANPEVRILEGKLKATKERRCNMIFDSLSPNYNDVIYMSEIDTQLRYLHPNTMHCLQLFFKSFYLQTKRNHMNRKYFTVNILTALEKGKFDLHLLFQDPDILELEKRAAILKFGHYERDKMFSKNTKPSVQESSSKETEESQNKLQLYKLDLPLQRAPEKRTNNHKNTETSALKTDSNSRSQERENLIEAHSSQRENHRKLKEYLSRHFKMDVVEAALEKEGSNISIQGIAPRNTHSHNQLKPTPAEVVRRLSTNNCRNKSIHQTSEEVAYEKCTFEPKLYKPLKSVINKQVHAKVYDFMQRNKYINEVKNISHHYEKTPKRTREHDSPQKHSALEKSENNNYSVYFSGRHQKEEDEENVTTFDLGYKNMHDRKVEYAEQHLIPEYIELTTRRINADQPAGSRKERNGQRSSSHSRNQSVSKSPLRSKSIHEANWDQHLLPKEEPVQDINSYIEVRKKYYSYLNHHQSKNLESRLQSSPNLAKNKHGNSNNTNLKGVIFGGGDSKGKSEYIPVYTKNTQSSPENPKYTNRTSKSQVNTKSPSRSPTPKKILPSKMDNGGKQHKRVHTIQQSIPNGNQGAFVSFGPKHYLQKRITGQRNASHQENHQSFSFTERDISQM